MIIKHMFILVGAIAIAAWLVFFSINQVQQCERRGGTLVENAIWLSCAEARH